MKLSFGKFLVLAIAGVLLVHFCYSLYDDAVYFLTKRESTAKLIKVTRLGYDDHCQVEFYYYNTYLKKNTTGFVTLKPKPFTDFNKPNQNYILLYGRNEAVSVFLKDNGAPRITILLSDLLMIVIMLAAIFINKDLLKKEAIA